MLARELSGPRDRRCHLGEERGFGLCSRGPGENEHFAINSELFCLISGLRKLLCGH